MPKLLSRALAVALLSMPLVAPPLPVAAQVPDHVPGTICFTATFWCWAPQPGFAGQPCNCPTADGFVPGTLG